MRVHSVNIRTTAPAAPWRQHRRDKKEDAVLMRVLYRQLNHDGDLPLNPEKRWLRKSRALHAMVSLQLGLNDLRLPLAVIAGESKSLSGHMAQSSSCGAASRDSPGPRPVSIRRNELMFITDTAILSVLQFVSAPVSKERKRASNYEHREIKLQFRRVHCRF